MIRKAADIKLKVLPVYAAAEHLYYYEGPCRFGQGEALQPGFDAIMTAQMISDYNAKLKEIAPEAFLPQSITRHSKPIIRTMSLSRLSPGQQQLRS